MTGKVDMAIVLHRLIVVRNYRRNRKEVESEKPFTRDVKEAM